MSETWTYALIKLLNSSTPIYKIVHKSSLLVKGQKNWLKFKEDKHLNKQKYFRNVVGGQPESVVILDKHEDAEVLRRKNAHISTGRIPLVKRRSIATPAKRGKKTKSQEEELERMRVRAEIQGDKEGDQFFNNIDWEGAEDDRDDAQGVSRSDSENDSNNFSLPPRRSVSPILSPRRTMPQDRNVLQDVQNLQFQAVRNNQRMEELRKVIVTKKDLKESLSGFIDTVRSVNKDNNNTQPIEPEFDAEYKVKILDDFSMSFDNYTSAINATSNSKRAKKVMADFWPKEVRLGLVTQYDSKHPEMTIVSKVEYAKLTEIMKELQTYRSITAYTKQDEVMANMKRWVMEWLKSYKNVTKKKNDQ